MQRVFLVGAPAVNGRDGVALSGIAAMCRERHIKQMKICYNYKYETVFYTRCK